MKFIGCTADGDFLVSVNKSELDKLKEIERGYDDLDRASAQWKETDAAKVLARADVRSFWKLFEMFRTGEFDGSLESISKVARGEIRVDYIGKKTMNKIQKALEP